MFNEAPLFFAIRKNNIEIIKLLLSNDKVDVNANGIHNTNVFLAFKKEIFQ